MAKRYARVKIDRRAMDEQMYGPAYECSVCHIHVRSHEQRTICMECEEKQAAQPVVREQGDTGMATREMRGYYHVTVKSDHEVWQLSYTDGSLGAPQIIPNDSNLLEVCSRCQRKWSHQDRGLRYDFESGLMICPMCIEKELQALSSVNPAHLTDEGQARVQQLKEQ